MARIKYLVSILLCLSMLSATAIGERKNSTFTDKNNESGLIVGDKVAKLLNKYVHDDKKDDFELILERTWTSLAVNTDR